MRLPVEVMLPDGVEVAGFFLGINFDASVVDCHFGLAVAVGTFEGVCEFLMVVVCLLFRRHHELLRLVLLQVEGGLHVVPLQVALVLFASRLGHFVCVARGALLVLQHDLGQGAVPLVDGFKGRVSLVSTLTCTSCPRGAARSRHTQARHPRRYVSGEICSFLCALSYKPSGPAPSRRASEPTPNPSPKRTCATQGYAIVFLVSEPSIAT